MENLTARQAEILDFIKSCISETGMPPTRKDISEDFGFRSPNAAEEHLKALARKGYIEIIAGTSRGIRVLIDDGVPIVGEVAAGSPLLAEENINGYCDIPSSLFSPHVDNFLRVKGLSMKDIGIFEGDLLAVHKTSEARKGQIVIARIGNEVTVKRYSRQRNAVYLLPENQDFEPIKVDAKSDEFAIEGIGVGIIRNGSL